MPNFIAEVLKDAYHLVPPPYSLRASVSSFLLLVIRCLAPIHCYSPFGLWDWDRPLPGFLSLSQRAQNTAGVRHHDYLPTGGKPLCTSCCEGVFAETA